MAESNNKDIIVMEGISKGFPGVQVILRNNNLERLLFIRLSKKSLVVRRRNCGLALRLNFPLSVTPSSASIRWQVLVANCVCVFTELMAVQVDEWNAVNQTKGFINLDDEDETDKE